MPRDSSTREAALETASVGLIYVLVAVWWLWPLPAEIATHRPTVEKEVQSLFLADWYLIVWALCWGAKTLLTAPWDIFQANAFHPAPTSLAYSEHFLGYFPTFAPTYWLTGNPLLASNLLLVAHPVLRGLAVFLLVRRFAGGPAGFVAGLAFGFEPAARETILHLHMQGIYFLPLAMLFSERWLEQARTRDAVLLCVCLILQSATSFYLAYAQVMAFGIYVPLALLGWRDRLDRRRLVGLGLAILGVGGAMLILGLPYLMLKGDGLIPEYDASSMGLWPATTAARVRAGLREGSVGMVGYALVAVALVPPLLRRGRLLLLGTALVAVGIVAAHGPTILIAGVEIPSPYRILVDFVPGFSSIRVPRRFFVVAHLGLALLAGAGVARLAGRFPRRFAWTSAVASGAALLWMIAPAAPLATAREDTIGDLPPAYQWLAEHGGQRPVLEWPGEGFVGRGHRMYLSTFHWGPIVDGYSAYPPDSQIFVRQLARGLPRGPALQRLVDHVDIEWILLRGEALTAKERARWNRLPDGLELAGKFAYDRIYRVTRRPNVDRRDLLFRDDRTLDGAPRERLDGPCPGTIEVLERPPLPWRAPSDLTVKLRFENDSEVSWPASGILPRHLVHLQTCWSRKKDQKCSSSKRIPLRRDIGAGESLERNYSLRTPPSAGFKWLHLWLEQVEGPDLRECGVAPVHMEVELRTEKAERRERERQRERQQKRHNTEAVSTG